MLKIVQWHAPSSSTLKVELEGSRVQSEDQPRQWQDHISRKKGKKQESMKRKRQRKEKRGREKGRKGSLKKKKSKTQVDKQ